MRLLSFKVNGLRLYDHDECAMSLYATDAVRDPGFTRPLPGAARSIRTNTVIGIAGINASGKTTALRVIEFVIAVASGRSLSAMTNDLTPLYDIMSPTVHVQAILEQDGRFHRLDSTLDNDPASRTPLRFIRETLSIHHGKLSKIMLGKALTDPDPLSWNIEATRNIGRPGLGGELTDDAKRYLPSDRSICGAYVADTDINAELMPISPTLAISQSLPVIGLFDPSIERLSHDKDGIHLKFRSETESRDVSLQSLANMVSSGTLRGGALFSRAIETLRSGGYLLVDELENSINKQLVFVIMDLFASPVTNPNGATLVFSTHYPELLDHFTRKDSIWFAVRDGEGFGLRGLGTVLTRADQKKSVSFFANTIRGTAPSYETIKALTDYVEETVNAL